MRLLSFSFICLFILCGKFSAQNFYDVNTIQKIEITFLQPNWDYQLDTSKAGADGYIMAAGVTINGIAFDSVGVKYKGNSSYNPTYKKNPLHIELDTYKSQSYSGIKDVKLGNNYADPSMIREVLAYDILQNYMHCPQSNFAKVYINGVYYGVFANTENIGKQFYSNHFYSSNNTAIKCNPLVNPSVNTKSNLKYFTTGDSSNYFNFYEIKSTYGWNDLRTLCDTVTNFQSKAADNLDIDRVIWMLAYNNVVVNLDSYSGAFCQNYYLYKDNTNHYNPTIWDLNMSFGGFPYAGSSNTSLSQQSITGLQQLPINIHATDAYWPLINIVNNNAQYKRMLVAHMRTITNEFFAGSTYVTKAQQYQTLIDTLVQSDTMKFYSYTQFQNGLTSNTSIGSYSVPGISNLMSARVTYLQGTTDFSYTTPTISSINTNTLTPALGSTVSISANVINANSNGVYLGYRNDITKKFTRVLMYDDGLHNDGISGDNVFAANVIMAGSLMEYYIYAENNNAGMFSPQRAEHEFYSLQSNVAQPNYGELKINEFLAVNQSGAMDENSQYEDWIELYNTTNNNLDLSGLYISDSYATPQKYAFPVGTIIPSNGYLTMWADDDVGTTDIHCNFKLSASGEQLILSKGTTILDSISFGTQTADVTMARCPNGTGAFAISTAPTFHGSNCLVSINEFSLNGFDLLVYPNPASEQITIETDSEKEFDLTIRNSLGAIVTQQKLHKKININTSNLSPGIYVISIGDKTIKLVLTH